MLKKQILIGALLGATSLGLSAPEAVAQNPLLGEIQEFGGNFCPRGYAGADGQLLAISQFSALFSLYGTMYGGDGRTTFALPDLRGRVPIHAGNGPGLTPRTEGQRGGVETTIMTVAEMPSHSHTGNIQTVDADADINSPRGNAISRTGQTNIYVSGQAPNLNFMRPETVVIQNAGGGQSQENRQPVLAIRYCVATQGIFPSRN